MKNLHRNELKSGSEKVFKGLKEFKTDFKHQAGYSVVNAGGHLPSFQHDLIYWSLFGDLLYMYCSHLYRWSDNTQVQRIV